MKILTFSSLFPNAARPRHGIFVETRLRHLVASGKVESRVVAPIPWFPFKHPRFGEYAALGGAPRAETRFGIKVIHPRYPLPPKIGMTIAPLMLYQASKNVIERVIDEGYDFDLIDAHYFYPDGVAAVMLGKYFSKPVTITARGSDINVIPRFAIPRRMIQWAARNANASITVSEALRTAIIGVGAEPSRTFTLRNGVDLDWFHPMDRQAQRKKFGLTGFTLLSVGHLVTHKGHDLVIEALVQLPEAKLIIAGDGPERSNLEALAHRSGVSDRVTFVGNLTQADLRDYYNAADVLMLASSREGWANVLLESMACGTPVVASKVGGTPEVVASPDAGRLMPERTAKGVADTVKALRAAYPTREATRKYAGKFSWNDTTQGQLDLFAQILAKQEHV